MERAGERMQRRQQRHHAPADRAHGDVRPGGRRGGAPTPPAEIELKDPKDWTIAGKPLPRLDTADKLTGKQKYGIDLTQPNMLNAAVRACPVFGGKLASFDAAAVEKMPGVQ